MDAGSDEFIQGVGNEVFYFFLLLSVLLVVGGAWFSTQVVEPVVSSVILVERTSLNTAGLNREGGELTQYTSEPNRSSNLILQPSSSANSHHDEQHNDLSVSDAIPPVSAAQAQSLSDDSQAPSNTSTVSSPLAAHLHTQTASEQSESNTASPPSTDQTDSIPQEDRVIVRLKFLNETQRDVEASLLENIGNFKRRNFTMEMSQNKNVRLIFNGQLLRDEATTLQGYGIFDKCVVHCLIQQQSGPAVPPVAARPEATENGEDLDVSELFIPVLGVGLIILWYFAFTYSPYFNTMSSTALLGLTLLFLISVYGTNFHVNVANLQVNLE